MSANLDLVRSIYADWERGDYTDIGWAHPDIGFVMEDVPDSGTRRGVTGMVEAWGEFLSAWEGHRVEVEEYRELDAERVLVLGHFVAQGKTSGLDLQQTRTEGANLFHIREGKITRLVIYFDRDRAFAELGLTPEGKAP
jgi:ketosteroid isomerase-like protein